MQSFKNFVFISSLILLNTPSVSADGLIQCQSVKNRNGEERLLCPGNDVLFKKSEIKPRDTLFLSGQTEGFVKTGEKNSSSEEMRCKVVYFDGVRNVYCNGKLYAQNFNQHVSYSELTEFDGTKRDLKPRITDYDSFSNSNSGASSSISK